MCPAPALRDKIKREIVGKDDVRRASDNAEGERLFLRPRKCLGERFSAYADKVLRNAPDAERSEHGEGFIVLHGESHIY